MNKLTNRNFFNAILSNADSLSLPAGMTATDVREWANHQIDLLDRKNINKKPTEAQEAAAIMMDTVSQFLAEHRGECFTCAELIAHEVFPAGTQSQRAASVCNKLVAADRAEKGTLKGKTVFMAPGVFDTIEGIKPYKSKSAE